MTVQELRDLLEGVDGDLPVRLAQQPNYPLDIGIAGVTDVVEQDHPETGQPEKVVYILEGSFVGYASRELWNI